MVSFVKVSFKPNYPNYLLQSLSLRVVSGLLGFSTLNGNILQRAPVPESSIIYIKSYAFASF